MKRTRLVSATRLTKQAFWERSLLGQSLLAMPDLLRPELALRFENYGPDALGLSALYNRALEACPEDRYLLFVHDDVYLHDTFIEQRIDEGLQENDVLGLAGSRGGNLSEPSWALAFDQNLNGIGFQADPAVARSGFVSHCLRSPEPLGGVPPAIKWSGYGETPARCSLLDGLFLAVDPIECIERRVRFDERFDFHLYDLDFCRSAERAGLWLSTWPIVATHGSGGAYGATAWKTAARLYLDKWDCKHPSRSLQASLDT